MASDDTTNLLHSSMPDEDEHHPHNLSRLSMCTTNSKHPAYQDYGEMGMNMSRLQIEGSDGGDADEELSNDDKEGKRIICGVSSDSDKEPGCFSLPGTPPRRRIQHGYLNQSIGGMKDYTSENEAGRSKIRRSSRRRIIRERWLERAWGKKKELESDQCFVITKPKGGSRSLCMDLDELKACRDLGFELEHEMLEIPSRISMSTIDTSSGGNSPIAQWRISSPGDDPRDVKARLKVWAQAVALASSSGHAT